MQPKNRRAFSMFEISLVLAIIVVMLVGIMKAQSLFDKSRLATAQSLTQNSPVKDIADMILWYETSLDSSFLATEAQDGATVSLWNDNNPNASPKNNAVQSTLASRPKFFERTFNKAIPALRFDGTDDFLTFDGTPFTGVSYTIFVVEQRRSNASQMAFLGGTSAGATANLQVGYRSDTVITQAHSGTVLNDLTVSGYSVPTPMIHTFWFNLAAGQKYWANGGVTADDSDATFTAALTSYPGAAIGRYISNYLNGDIAEIIAFNRALQSSERQIVESYLSQKYGITIQ